MKTITKKAFISLLLISLFSVSVLADNGDPVKETKKVHKVTGKIVDQQTGEALTGVKVFLEGSDNAVYTDFDGEFEMEYVEGENTQLAVSLISYENQNVKLGCSDSYNIELKRNK